MPRKAISPIIAIIIILLITIAIAGAGYSYISTYWTSLVGKEIQVVSTFCTGDNQAKIMVKNIGTNPLRTGEITVINPNTRGDLTQDVAWTTSISDPSLVLELKFEEGSGTLARDTSGQGNDGTLKNATGTFPCFTNGACPEWVDGKAGKALSFDGSGDYVEISDDNSLDVTGNNEVTVSAWVKTISAHKNGIVAKGTGLFSTYLLQTWDDQLMHFSIYDEDKAIPLPADGQQQVNSSIQHPLNTWFHLVGTYDGSTLILYKDGEEIGSSSVTSTPTNNNHPLLIGYDGSAQLIYLNGIIDEVSVYSRALSPDEVKALYENSVLLQPGETATLTHTCTGRCRYSLVLGGMAKEAMLQC